MWVILIWHDLPRLACAFVTIHFWIPISKPVGMRVDEKSYIGVLFTALEETVHTRRVTNVTFLVTNVTSRETAQNTHLAHEIAVCALTSVPSKLDPCLTHRIRPDRSVVSQWSRLEGTPGRCSNGRVVGDCTRMVRRRQHKRRPPSNPRS